jgi:4-hydroxy-tetrahydrodipicolinate synthase
MSKPAAAPGKPAAAPGNPAQGTGQTSPTAEAKTAKERATGIWPPVATPFRADLSIDFDRYIVHCRRLLKDGAHGLAVLGTTSEANSLDIGERENLLERLIKVGIPGSSLLPGTGACSIGDSARLTRHAVALGVRGVLLLPPFYYKGVTDGGLYTYVNEVIKRVGDKRLKIYLYNFPQMTTITWSPALVGLLIHDFPDTVVGLKDSSGDVAYTETLLELYPGFAVFPSSESLLLGAMRKGAAGCISATANTHVGNVRRLYDGWKGPDAQILHEKAATVRAAIQPYGWIPAVKAILAARENSPEWMRVRPPLEPLDEKRKEALLSAVAEAGG